MGMYSSCGLIDMDTDENVQQAYEMSLGRDTVYAMVGDSFMVKPVFTPEIVSNVEIFWFADYDSIIRVINDTIVAVGEGKSFLHGISVQDVKEDSTLVIVMPEWTYQPYNWPYETVVYANVRLNGEPLPAYMKVAAFVGDECRGIGEKKNWNGISYTQFRIGSEMFSYPDPTSDDIYINETIRFVLYDPETHMLSELDETMTFDGETHGTISNLYKMDF